MKQTTKSNISECSHRLLRSLVYPSSNRGEGECVYDVLKPSHDVVAQIEIHGAVEI